MWQRWWNRAEALRVIVLGRCLGIDFVVRYLQNPHPGATVAVLRAFGATVGDHARVKRRLYLDNVSEDQDSSGDLGHLTLGDHCYVGDGVYLDLAGPIEIAERAVLSAEVAIITHADCNRSPYLAQQFPRQCAGVRIGPGAWIGLRSTLLAGVSVGANAMVASHALVKDDVEPLTLQGGVPARPIRRLDEPPDVLPCEASEPGRRSA